MRTRRPTRIVFAEDTVDALYPDSQADNAALAMEGDGGREETDDSEWADFDENNDSVRSQSPACIAFAWV